MVTEGRETTRAARRHFLRLSLESSVLLYENISSALLVHTEEGVPDREGGEREAGRRNPGGKGLGTFLLSCGRQLFCFPPVDSGLILPRLAT
jgi:hypothetical protein